VNVKRNLSISTSFAYDIPVEKQIPLIAAAGFNYVSPGASLKHCNYLSKETRHKLIKLLEQYGLKMDTLHAPLTGSFDIGLFKETAEAAAEFGAPVVVLHCSPFEINASELPASIRKLKEDCRELVKISRQTGVTFALENQAPGPAAELIRRVLLETDSPYLGFCYDSSHDQVDGPRPFDLLKELKDKLVAVHLSDRIKPFTDHVLPWEGFIHWDELIPILKECNITFPLLFEVAITHSAEKDPVKFLALAYERACRLWDEIFG